MAHQEKISESRERISVPDRSLETIADRQREVIQENLEKHEKAHHEKLEDIRDEVEKVSVKHEKENRSKEKESSAEKLAERRGHGKISKKQKDITYKKTLKTIQSDLPLASRSFSKVIHNKAVEKVSDIVGSTVARPNAILAGSAFAFVFTLAIFLVARYYGYPLSGAETIAGFAVGWATGVLFDYLRLMISGKPS